MSEILRQHPLQRPAEELLAERDIQVSLPRQGPLTPKPKDVRYGVAFRRAYRWLAGIEGRISVLMDKSRRHAHAIGQERAVGGVVDRLRHDGAVDAQLWAGF